MIKKTYTYIDYNGNERTETNWFNLSKAEMLEMELSTENGLSDMVQEIIKSNDSARIVEVFKDIILKSYGIKSPDGRRFNKTKELRDEFASTEFYSLLFTELATNAESAAAFINGVVADNVAKESPIALISQNTEVNNNLK